MKNKSFELTRPKNENKKVLLFLQLLLVFLIASGGILFVYYGFAQKAGTTVTFDEKGSADYKVYLKKNDYYSSNYLGKGMSYVASLIDKVYLSFNYKLDSNLESFQEYKYRIDAELIITERGEANKVLFRQPIVLKEETVANAHTHGAINESLSIRYDEYNAIVNRYKNEYSLSVSSNLVVKMHVDTKSEATGVDGAKYNSSNDLVISIPLSEQTIEINFDSNEINNTKEIVQYSTFNPINYIYIFLGIILVISALVFLFKTLTKKSNNISYYEKTKNNILRQYDRFIVETDKIENLSKDKLIIPVNSFTELLDARDNTENPILFYENADKKVAKFTVIDGNNMFIYQISDEDKK